MLVYLCLIYQPAELQIHVHLYGNATDLLAQSFAKFLSNVTLKELMNYLADSYICQNVISYFFLSFKKKKITMELCSL